MAKESYTIEFNDGEGHIVGSCSVVNNDSCVSNVDHHIKSIYGLPKTKSQVTTPTPTPKPFDLKTCNTANTANFYLYDDDLYKESRRNICENSNELDNNERWKCFLHKIYVKIFSEMSNDFGITKNILKKKHDLNKTGNVFNLDDYKYLNDYNYFVNCKDMYADTVDDNYSIFEELKDEFKTTPGPTANNNKLIPTYEGSFNIKHVIKILFYNLANITYELFEEFNNQFSELLSRLEYDIEKKPILFNQIDINLELDIINFMQDLFDSGFLNNLASLSANLFDKFSKCTQENLVYIDVLKYLSDSDKNKVLDGKNINDLLSDSESDDFISFEKRLVRKLDEIMASPYSGDKKNDVLRTIYKLSKNIEGTSSIISKQEEILSDFLGRGVPGTELLSLNAKGGQALIDYLKANNSLADFPYNLRCMIDTFFEDKVNDKAHLSNILKKLGDINIGVKFKLSEFIEVSNINKYWNIFIKYLFVIINKKNFIFDIKFIFKVVRDFFDEFGLGILFPFNAKNISNQQFVDQFDKNNSSKYNKLYNEVEKLLKSENYFEDKEKLKKNKFINDHTYKWDSLDSIQDIESVLYKWLFKNILNKSSSKFTQLFVVFIKNFYLNFIEYLFQFSVIKNDPNSSKVIGDLKRAFNKNFGKYLHMNVYH